MTHQPIEIMSESNDVITNYLQKLDLNEDQAELFVYLNVLGPSTVLALSKALKTGRTRLYPVLESLADMGLVVIHERHYGTTYEALTPQALEFLVHEKETQAQSLREELFDVQNALLQLSGTTTKGSKVIEYKGPDGLKQINFNLTKAHKEFCVYEVAHLDEHIGMPASFVNRLRRTWIDKKITSRDLTNNTGWKPHNEIGDPDHKYQQASLISPDIFCIELETLVYNDCIAYLQYDKGEVFGVEIYNEMLAAQQKQLFNLVWAQGTIIH